MNPFRKKTDRELVDALRRNERFRRPAGLVLIVLGLALLEFHLWGAVWMKDTALRLASSVVDIQRMVAEVEAARGIRPAEKPDEVAPLAYTLGFSSGLKLSQGVMLGSLSLVLGIRLCFGGRKDRLLSHYFDLATNGHVGPKG